MERQLVDQERLDRLLDRLASDLKVLHGHRVAGEDLLDDPTRLAAVKLFRLTGHLLHAPIFPDRYDDLSVTVAAGWHRCVINYPPAEPPI